MDLSPYMNPTPYTLTEETPLIRAFDLYRTMGLRHIPILDQQHCIVGIITRKELTVYKLHDLDKAFYRREAARKNPLELTEEDMVERKIWEDFEDDLNPFGGDAAAADDYFDDADAGGGIESRPRWRSQWRLR